MKIIDAFWEKRNLDVDCIEINIHKQDNVSDLEEISNLLETAEYVVVKVPVAQMDINEYLTKLDFVFVQVSINFQLNVKGAFLTPLQHRLNNVTSYIEMSKSDLSQLYIEMENGLFKTDRIFLDNQFTEKQAATRYINWIKDELAKTTQIYKVVYKEYTIGFFTFKEVSENVYFPFLGGLYKKYSNSGLGFTIVRKQIEEALKRNGKSISTYASSNNPGIIRALAQQGFSIKDMQYVYIKHNI